MGENEQFATLTQSKMAKIPREIVERREREDARVVAVLRRAGVDVTSVYDLVNDSRSRQRAVDPLLEVLPEIDDPVVKEGIVRALTDAAARGVAAVPLVRELYRARDEGQELLAWAIGNALEIVADQTVLPDMLQLAQDPRLGKGREAVVQALARFKKEDTVRDLLRRLLQDEEVAGHAIIALRKLKASAARSEIEPFLKHEKTWVRREATKALVQFDKGRIK